MFASVLQTLTILMPAAASLTGWGRTRQGSVTVTALTLLFAIDLLLWGLPAGEALVTAGMLYLDELSIWLLPYAALIGCALVVYTPRKDRSPALTASLLVSLSIDLAFFSLKWAPALAFLWVCSHIPLWAALPHDRALRRILLLFLGGGCVLFLAGVATGNLALLLAGVLMRKGVIPVHQWLPELFAKAPIPHVLAFCAPQLGAYACVRLVVPSASPSMLLGLGTLGLVTSLYGACLAFAYKDVRRVFAGIFMGQTSLVFAGLQCTSEAGLAGGLTLWLSGGLALLGLGCTLWGLETRRGPQDLSRFHGGFERTPRLAAAFLLFGLAAVGFPGTVGFLSEELLLEGTIHTYPHVGILVAVTAAMNSLTVMRAYFHLFCGSARQYLPSQGLVFREDAALTALLLPLLLFGLLPQTVISSRWKAADTLLAQRAAAAKHYQVLR